MTAHTTLGIFLDRELAALVGVVARDALKKAMCASQMLIVLLVLPDEAAAGGYHVVFRSWGCNAKVARATGFSGLVNRTWMVWAVTLCALDTGLIEGAPKTG